MFENWANRLKEKKQQANNVGEITFKPYTPEEPEAKTSVREEENAKVQGSVVSQNPDSNIELKVVRPESFNEVSDIADHLLDGCTVVLNVEILDKPSIIRMLDFLNGVTYSRDGDIKQVSQSTYIITPNGIGISDEE